MILVVIGLCIPYFWDFRLILLIQEQYSHKVINKFSLGEANGSATTKDLNEN